MNKKFCFFCPSIKIYFIGLLRFFSIWWVIELIPINVNAQVDSIRILLLIPDTINTVFIVEDAYIQFEGISDTSYADFIESTQKLEININNKWYSRGYLTASDGGGRIFNSSKYPILIDLYTICLENYSELSQFIVTGGLAQIRYSCPTRTSEYGLYTQKNTNVINLNIPPATSDDIQLMNFVQQMKDSIPSFKSLLFGHRIASEFEFNAYRDVRDKYPNSILNEIIILQYQESVCGGIAPNESLGQDLLNETKNVYNKLKQSKFNWIRNNLDLLEWYINK
jgi:hypothetical protein